MFNASSHGQQSNHQIFVQPHSLFRSPGTIHLVKFIWFLYCSLLHGKESYISLCLYTTDEKVTVLESEKRAWESSPEAQAMREALNPWHKHDEQQQGK
jgi:hypothetical protein